ncbi:histidine phosphatase family protein [Sporosarcina ureilytica]|uniref:Histidine phosphatase family protein n=1 Tax=Sporosarcina ureilytica TaxID=298596 RepID=A0A1D8JJH2_9BACL|nr:histidine phosphatase family protein [Sporosarcina ureilytica]AOV08865.1 hypothetical protein BI350_15785 [Sporosarcina ureilytica]
MAHRVVLTLIRHLPTAGNIKRQYIGWTDESIVENEINELPWQPSVVYGSDLRRCQESAHLYFPKATYQSDHRFRESNFGDWEGKTYELLKRDSAYRSWINSPYRCQPPNGESLAEVKARVLQAIYDLPSGEEDYFIVTHGGPIRILLTEFAPEQNDFWSWIIPHQSVWQLRWDCEQDLREGKRCASLSAVPITGNGLT